MDWGAVAIANLRFSLEVASAAYSRFVEYPEAEGGRPLLMELSDERFEDADRLGRAAASVDLDATEPMLDQPSAEEMLGIGRSEPYSLASIAYRVQRAENTLARLASQLQTVIEQRTLQGALTMVRHHIESRREDVRALRRSASG